MGKNEINLAGNLINIINTARENALKKVNKYVLAGWRVFTRRISKVIVW
mgnify:CR=1 FL=1